MIIEIGQGLMTILVLAFIFTLFLAPELLILVAIVGVIGLVGLGASNKPITIKGPEGVIFQTSVDVNATPNSVNVKVVK